MSEPLILGFAPLTDAAPVIVAEAKKFFAAEGLAVELRREVSWATVRDKLCVGALDAAHLLAPLALATSVGLSCAATPLIAPLMLNRGGAAVTVSSRIARGADLGAALRRLISLRREQGASELTFAVVFPYAIHAYFLRDWLTGAGLDPDRDVRLTVAPPSRMAELLADGVIDGFCAGEPWNAAAVAAAAGQVAARSGAVWPQAPDKLLAVRAAGLAQDPARLAALVRAVAAAAAWAARPQNRGELLAMLAEPRHLGLAPDLIAPGLADIRFAGEGVNAPTPADGAWLVAQMERWGQLPDPAAAQSAAAALFRPDLFAAAVPASA